MREILRRVEMGMRGCGAALLLGMLLASPGCSTRVEKPVLAADSTLVYPGKKAGDVSATITLASKSKVSKKTGKHLGVSRAFDIGKDEKVFAFVDIQNQHARGDRPLGFHLVWLDPTSETIFKKMITFVPNDSVTSITSALSTGGGKREPGEYTFRVYLFRELIAEKSFTLRGTGIEPERTKPGEGEM